MLDWIQANIPPWLPLLLVVHLVVLVTVAYLILLERKSASWMQDRLGPNRVGPYGLLQPLADGLKFFLKEDYRARSVDKVLFTLAPVIMIVVIIISIASFHGAGSRGQPRPLISRTCGATDIACAPRWIPRPRQFLLICPGSMN